MRILAMLLVGCSALVLTCCKKSDDPRVIEGRAMGTDWRLAYRGDREVRAEVAAEIERWEQVLSQWRADSDLSRFNRGEPASADLQRVLDLAGEFELKTGGAFDAGVLAEVHRAGFGPEGEGVDLSAIGKGFAVDRVGERLRSMGIDHFIFELGGEVLAGEGEWRCGVQSPVPGGEWKKLSISNQAIATSGNYYQYRKSNDGMISHIIDPATGDPIVRPPVSVTVMAEDCATADVWATALFVLGPGVEPEGAPEFFWMSGEVEP
ncbi:MAG: FAD:protein FMN transferase [Verrucomicrobiota bacterium]